MVGRPAQPSLTPPTLLGFLCPLLVCFLEGLERARLAALRAWLNSRLLPVLGIALTMYLEVQITLPDAMVGQRLRAPLALAFCDVLFSRTLRDSTTASAALLHC